MHLLRQRPVIPHFEKKHYNFATTIVPLFCYFSTIFLLQDLQRVFDEVWCSDEVFGEVSGEILVQQLFFLGEPFLLQ
jgi:hypothetical protein